MQTQNSPNSSDSTRSNSPIISRPQGQGGNQIKYSNDPHTDQYNNYQRGGNDSSAMDEEKTLQFILPGKNNNVKKIGDNQEFSTDRIHIKFLNNLLRPKSFINLSEDSKFPFPPDLVIE